MEPNLADDVVAALYAPTGAIVCPFNLTIALAENAADNGVEFLLNTSVEKISREGDHFLIETNGKTIEAKAVVNAAGVYADAINNMVSSHKYHIIPRRGQYMLLDKTAGSHVRRTIFQLQGLVRSIYHIYLVLHNRYIPLLIDVQRSIFKRPQD